MLFRSQFGAVFLILGLFFTFDTMKYIGLGASVVQLLFACAFISESLPPERRVPVTRADLLHNPFAAMISITKSKLATGLTVMLFFYVISQVGTGDIYFFYLKQRIDFNSNDNIYLALADGVASPFAFLLLLPALLRYVSPAFLATLTLGAIILELIAIATLWAKWAAFAIALPIVLFVALFLPVTLGLVQNSCPADQLGQRLAGVTAVIDLGKAIGPLLFGLIYAHVNNTLIFLPFLLCAVLAIPAIVLSLKVTRWLTEKEHNPTASS